MNIPAVAYHAGNQVDREDLGMKSYRMREP